MRRGFSRVLIISHHVCEGCVSYVTLRRLSKKCKVAKKGGYCGDAAGDAGGAPSRLRRPRDSERAVAGRRGGGATPAHCGWFAMAKSNVAGFEYQYGGGTSRRKSSSAAFIAAIVCA